MKYIQYSIESCSNLNLGILLIALRWVVVLWLKVLLIFVYLALYRVVILIRLLGLLGRLLLILVVYYRETRVYQNRLKFQTILNDIKCYLLIAFFIQLLYIFFTFFFVIFIHLYFVFAEFFSRLLSFCMRSFPIPNKPN